MNLDNKLSFVLLRHGETIYNTEKKLQSPKDSLNKKGKEQIKILKEKLSSFNFDKIISSDEKRAVESSEIISSFLKMDFNTSNLLREKSSGDFSGKLINEVDWSTVEGSFLDKKVPNGDSVKDVIFKALEFFKFMNEQDQGKKILVISHGTFLRILFCLIFNKNIKDYLLNYEFPNATYLIISRSEDGKWELEESSLIKKRNQ